MSHARADYNLLFGILALQMDFVPRDGLIAAMNAWVLDKGKLLSQILRETGHLGEDEHALLEALVHKHLQKHRDDPEQSLAAVSSIGALRDDLRQIADSEVKASLAHVSTARPEADPHDTGPYVPPRTLPPHARFRILRPHAKGGLGEVFVAEDQELHREVALKEIQERHAAEPAYRTRFLLEAEVTGCLEHPGIVPIYSLGHYADGRPFYAMRFIRGDSLQEAIAQFHRAKPSHSPGERTLGLRKLLGRFLDVCNAIAYAHSRGVLHRDLKPGNIMLGKYGETLVVDWGLAKVVGRAELEAPEGLLPVPASDSALTQAGTALGTPAYTSPEQAAGRLDQLGPRSDVYSLGATLYCLLTGRAPFHEGEVGQVLRKVQRGDFPRPRDLDRHIAPALEAICLKAMALQPGERYASPRALADDLEHWLADEPFAAYREPRRQRLARWARRHRTAVTSAGVAVALLLAGAVGGWLLWESAEQKRHEQAQEYRIQARSSAEADERLALAEVAADRLASAEQILKQACERLLDQPQLGDLRARLEARRDRIGRLVRFYHLADQVERRIYFNQSRQARAAAEQGLAALDIAAGPSWWDHLPAAELTPEQIDKLKKDAYRLLLLTGGLRALDGFTRFGTPEAAQAFHSAILAFDQAEQHRPSRTGSYMSLFCRFGLGQQNQLKVLPAGEPTSDVDHYLMGLAHLAMVKKPDNPVVKLLLARLGALLQDLDLKTPAATAEKHLRRAVELNPRHFFHHLYLGQALRVTNQLQSAELALNACVVLRPDGALGYRMRAEALRSQYWASTDPIRKAYLIKRMLEDEGEVIRLEPTAEAFGRRGATLILKGDLDRAIEDFSEAIRRDPRQDVFYERRGYAYYRKGALDRAVADVTRAIRLKPGVVGYHALRAEIYMEKQEYGKAVADYSEIIRLGQKTAKSYCHRGDAHYAKGAYDQARADYRKAFQLNPQEVTSYFASRAQACAGRRQWAKAAADLGKLVELVPDIAGYRRMHASLLLRGGDRDNYREACRQTLERFGQTKDAVDAFNAAFACSLSPWSPTDAKQVVALAERAVAADPTRAWFHTGLGAAYYRAGQYDKSVAALQKSLGIAQNIHHQATNWPLLAMACHQLGQKDKAREWLQKASQWHVKERAGQPESVFIWNTEWWYDGVDFENLLSEAKGLLKKAKR
jgi:serine/threonine protein kinase/Flp pilus assembly protein TadD